MVLSIEVQSYGEGGGPKTSAGQLHQNRSQASCKRVCDPRLKIGGEGENPVLRFVGSSRLRNGCTSHPESGSAAKTSVHRHGQTINHPTTIWDHIRSGTVVPTSDISASVRICMMAGSNRTCALDGHHRSNQSLSSCPDASAVTESGRLTSPVVSLATSMYKHYKSWHLVEGQLASYTLPAAQRTPRWRTLWLTKCTEVGFARFQPR